MKRLALLVIGLVFLFTTSVFAQAPPPAAPADKGAPAKVEEKKDVKKDVKKKKAAKKAKKAKKAEKKEMKEKEAAPAPADKK
jgi:hypothetical protein